MKRENFISSLANKISRIHLVIFLPTDPYTPKLKMLQKNVAIIP